MFFSFCIAMFGVTATQPFARIFYCCLCLTSYWRCVYNDCKKATLPNSFHEIRMKADTTRQIFAEVV